MIRTNRNRALALTAAGVALAAVSAGPAAASTSFAGKTIHIVVNFAAGGPADGFIRHFVPYLSDRIPGKPTVVVENRTGAAGRIGANYIYNVAPADGTAIGFLVAVAAQDIVGGKNVKFDSTKFRWLGAVPQTQVLLGHKSLGVADGMRLADTKQPIVFGTTGKSSNNALTTGLFLELIGVGFKQVTGYRGQAGTIQALRLGEVNFTDAGISIYLPNRESWRKEALFGAVAQRGLLQLDGSFTRHPTMPDLPTMAEIIAARSPGRLKTPEFNAIRALVGTTGVQFPLVLPPKAGKETAAALARAVAETFGDAKVRADAKRRFKYEYDFLDGVQSQAFVERLFADYRADPRVPKVVQRMLK